MGNPQSSHVRQGRESIDSYAIRLEPEQSLTLYGLIMAKKTLTWRDVVKNDGINMQTCSSCGIDAEKLFRLQPNLQEWIQNKKVTVSDCHILGPWKPNPFRDFKCTMGEVLIHKKHITPELLMAGGVTFKVLYEQHGLTPTMMGILNYKTDDWLELGITPEFLDTLSDAEWTRTFGSIARSDLRERARRQCSIAGSGELNASL